MTILRFSQTSSDILSFDVLIVGTGPACLAVTTELALIDLRLGVLESGGTHREEHAENLNESDVNSRARAHHPRVAYRVFGATSQLRTSRCGTLNL